MTYDIHSYIHVHTYIHTYMYSRFVRVYVYYLGVTGTGHGVVHIHTTRYTYGTYIHSYVHTCTWMYVCMYIYMYLVCTYYNTRHVYIGFNGPNCWNWYRYAVTVLHLTASIYLFTGNRFSCDTGTKLCIIFCIPVQVPSTCHWHSSSFSRTSTGD